MTATFAQTGDAGVSTIEGVALRRASLEDAKTIAKHRCSMFRDIGHHDEAALVSVIFLFCKANGASCAGRVKTTWT